jgi:diaminohydroxyphosphoribosylaminopyrimidine deaminase/5-amino-6-(5-phosphoribosylamino)uracil reductase
MPAPIDEKHLRQAIRLAMNGRGLVEPNPMVGCVIVRNDRIIGQGFHQQFGHPHAEPNALDSCTESPEGATAYVTLEPCCHTDKKTPPCVPRLVAAKIDRVVVGCFDPNPKVNGNGIRQLREAGISVDAPVLEAECKQLIAPFIALTVVHKPYVTMKWAQSQDGKIAGPGGKRVQISNSRSTHLVQLLRSSCDAILVGINTVIADDPMLLPRGVPFLRQVHRLVLDRKLRIPVDSQLVRTAKVSQVDVYCDQPPKDPQWQELTRAGVKIWATDSWRVNGNYTNVLVEPGRTLAASFFADNTVDRLWVIRSPMIIGDDTAPSAAEIPDHFIKTGELNLDGDVLFEYLNTRSSVYFAPEKSADLLLAESSG